MTKNKIVRPVVVVAGGSGDLGRAVVARFHGAGWRVLATYRRSKPITTNGITWIQFDGSVENHIPVLKAAVASTSGSLRAVVSLIGIPSSKMPIANTPASEWAHLFEGNVIANVRLWLAVSNYARRAQASVLFFSSNATQTLKPHNGPYTSAKAGLEAFAMTLAAEESKDGIRVNVLAPSLVDSRLAKQTLNLKGIKNASLYFKSLPWGRALKASEVARVAFDIVAAEHWSYMSGSTIRLAANRSA